MQSREGDSNRPIELRVLVHSSHAGAVIGRQGSKIKEMKEELGVQMKVIVVYSFFKILERYGFSFDQLLILESILFVNEYYYKSSSSYLVNIPVTELSFRELVCVSEHLFVSHQFWYTI